ncbi:AraC family transcriptional regulator, partial [Streptomyces sp. SID89]|nr:AraC family transcriptional regulator [Streptomyces sp. SID89]
PGPNGQGLAGPAPAGPVGMPQPAGPVPSSLHSDGPVPHQARRTPAGALSASLPGQRSGS